MITVGIFIKDQISGIYNRIELFDDEKISINSSIQNVNDISKVFTDYSQTFTIPASIVNNRIFKHWYENSLDTQFSTYLKADAYIELDTILFRTGKIQLEGCSIVNNQPQNYNITFIGELGSLKDKFAGLKLKDLDSNYYDFAYTPTLVKDKVTTTNISTDIMFPLISSDRYWTYAKGGSHDVDVNSHPIRYNELFPAIRVKSVFDLITRDSKWDIDFNGDFLTDPRFTNAYLWLKNAETFSFISTPQLITWDFKTETNTPLNSSLFFTVNLTTESFQLIKLSNSLASYKYFARIYVTPTAASIVYSVILYKNGVEISKQTTTSIIGEQSFVLLDGVPGNEVETSDVYTWYISSEQAMTFNSYFRLTSENFYYSSPVRSAINGYKTTNQTTSVTSLNIKSYFPDIKIEDFFSGILKMFNLTCYSTDGTNFTVEQLETYYDNGTIRDISEYVKTDTINLSRVKSYKKINFTYEKSESLVNVGFLSLNGVEYGSLLYSTDKDGEEYNIKLPFEDLNFNNLKDKLQVGYALKSDLQKYIPKPVILYDYNPSSVTSLTGTTYHFATALTGNGTAYTTYKAFGQEYNDFSLNFNIQQSTLNNEEISKSLYNQYYQDYFNNIFNYKSRIYKVNAMFPISILTSLKLNDRLIIRDKKFIINTMNTDLTTGEVRLELLTDFRDPLIVVPKAITDNFIIELSDLNPIDFFPLENDILGTPPTTITSVDTSEITTGTITITGSGSKITFTPNGTEANEVFYYTITDSLDNTSTIAATMNVSSTLPDTEAPSIVGELNIAEEFDTGFRAYWTVATDNVAVTGYYIMLNNVDYASVGASTLEYYFTGLIPNSSYIVSVAAHDAENNVGPFRDVYATTTYEYF